MLLPWTIDVQISSLLTYFFSPMGTEVRCVQGLPLWRDNTSVINDELFKGYRRGNTEEEINEFVAGITTFSYQLSVIFICVFKCYKNSLLMAAYDFLNSNDNTFSVNIWYNSTYNNYSAFSDAALVRVPRSLNLVCTPNHLHSLHLISLEYVTIFLA